MKNFQNQRCELCGMMAAAFEKDEHGVTHYYCEHHRPIAQDKNHDRHAGHSPEMFQTRFWVSLLLTIPVVLYAPMVQEWLGFKIPEFPGSNLIAPIFGTIIFFYGGTVFLKSALTELKARSPGMMTLIALAVIAAFLYSIATTFFIPGTEFFWELATLITVMLFGHWLEMKSVASAQGALKELAKLLPDKAEKIEDSKIETVAVSTLKVGDVILIRPGGKIAADGKVIEGQSEVNEAMITGESRPVEKTSKDLVIAGTVNGSGSLKVQVTKVGESTALAGIMRLVAQAQSSKSRTQIVADKAAFYLTVTAIIAASSALIGWLASQAGITFALERAVTVLVIACPHALGLAVPLVTAISTSKAASSGLLVRERIALESARNVDVVLFDKTGTLTKGEQGVVDVWAFGKYSKLAVLSLAAAAESFSQHPVGKAIVEAANKSKAPLKKATNFKSFVGKGVQANVGKQTILVGGPQLVSERNITLPKINSQGKTIIYVIEKDTIIGALSFADIIRDESKEAIKALKNMGIKVAMITGDSEDVAKLVSQTLGIDQYFSQVLPEHKVDKVLQLQKDGSKVAMVGDGVNDAPALIKADVGIAIGAGTDVAIESAGIILVKNDPRDVVKVINLSRSTYAKMVQNLFWATGYNVVAIPLAAGVLASSGIILAPAVGALLMSLSTVTVALNAQLIRRLKL